MRQPFTAVIGVVLLGCSGATEREAGTLRTWTVSAEPGLVIGENDALAGHELFGVRGATRLSDGRIAIANGGTSEIRYFSASGAHLVSVGREGRGPEEFRRIESVARGGGDTIKVLSLDPAILVISPEPRIVSKKPVAWEHMRFQCRIAESGTYMAADGSIVIQAEDNLGIAGCPPAVEGRSRNTDMLARLDASDFHLDTLGVFPGTERQSPRYAALGRLLVLAISADRIFAGETGGDSIAVFSLDGTRQATWHVPLEAKPIPESVRTRPPQPFRARDGTMVTPAPYIYDTTYPRFGRLLADRVGHLWVMAYPPLEDPITSLRLSSMYAPMVDPQGAEWTVLDSDGRTVATLRTPPGLFVLEIGEDYVLGLARNELDVESVRLYSLER